MGKQIRIGMVVPDVNDVTSWYRAVAPFSSLFKKHEDVTLYYPPAINWSTLRVIDILFIQRPFHPDHYGMLNMAKHFKIPVWIDFDDDNLSVPKGNRMFTQYEQAPVKDTIVKCIRDADAVTVSTDFILKKYSTWADPNKIHHIPNALDDLLLSFRNIPQNPRNQMIFYRGTESARKHPLILKNEIVDLANKYPDWKFGFLGYEPEDITNSITNFWHHNDVPLIDYFHMICNVHATALYQVVANDDHAMSRSHTAWLEATFAATPCFAPSHPEWVRPGVLNFSNPAQWKDIAESFIKGEIDCDKQVRESWECIQDKYLLSKVNEKRYDIIQQLLSNK